MNRLMLQNPLLAPLLHAHSHQHKSHCYCLRYLSGGWFCFFWANCTVVLLLLLNTMEARVCSLSLATCRRLSRRWAFDNYCAALGFYYCSAAAVALLLLLSLMVLLLQPTVVCSGRSQGPLKRARTRLYRRAPIKWYAISARLGFVRRLLREILQIHSSTKSSPCGQKV